MINKVKHLVTVMELRQSVYIIASLVTSGLCLPGPGNDAGAQLRLPGNVGDLTRLPEIELDRRLEKRVEETGELVDEVTDDAGALVATADGLIRNFVGSVDPDGRDIEEEIIVVLVETARADSLAQTATEIVSRRDLPALGRSLLILKRTLKLSMPEAIRSLRESNPGASVDYNHVYRLTSDSAIQPGADPAIDAAISMPVDAGAPRIGIVDSAVMREHRALRGVVINAQDFATHAGHRPLTHGTAVASLVADSSQNSAAIYSASVFFQVPNHEPGATAESIVAALDWLVAERVDVINMSLAGPGNRILEAAIAALVERDAAIVAAVGNNGPASEPLYPAAYDGVIGVTAVDARNRVFRHANRGVYVDYAARGVNVKVADSTTGGWRIESGTSMASPHVAVVAAQMLRASAIEPDTLMSWLMANAEDLGRKGFDEVFGHGLITRPPVVVSAN